MREDMDRNIAKRQEGRSRMNVDQPVPVADVQCYSRSRQNKDQAIEHPVKRYIKRGKLQFERRR